jgi:hypothetical protein
LLFFVVVLNYCTNLYLIGQDASGYPLCSSGSLPRACLVNAYATTNLRQNVIAARSGTNSSFAFYFSCFEIV